MGLYIKHRWLQVAFIGAAIGLLAILHVFWPREVTFSATSGFYEEPFLLKLHANPGAKLYYTLDGSEPTLNSQVYTDGIYISDKSSSANVYSAITGISAFGDFVPENPVDKGTIVKVLAVYAGLEKSRIYTETYFVGFDSKSGYDDVMVMAMTVHDEDFFSDETGIYMLGEAYEEWKQYWDGEIIETAKIPANYNYAERDWEREVNIRLWDDEKNLLVNNNIGVRIRGGWSRSFRQKGFNFYSRELYGEDDYELTGLMLRTSGYRDSYETMLRDVFNHSLVMDRDVIVQTARPCVLFINGEYWGLYNLQDRYTGTYFENNYGIDKDNLIVVKNRKRTSEGKDSDMNFYRQFAAFAAEHDLSKEENYEKIKQMMDIQSFIDFYSFECYIANMDWPNNNTCCFRSREITDGEFNDGRWRWAAYDTDDSTNVKMRSHQDYKGKDYSNPFDDEAHWAGNPLRDFIMVDLLKNEQFKQQFVTSFLDMMNVNFRYETVHEKLYALASIYADPVVKTQNRFNFTEEEYNAETFWKSIQDIDSFYKNRPQYILEYLADAMELSGETCEVHISTNNNSAGKIVVNTAELDLSDGTWTGIYYQDYPVRISVEPKEGWRFVGWEGTVSSQENEVVLHSGEMIYSQTAIFERIK